MVHEEPISCYSLCLRKTFPLLVADDILVFDRFYQVRKSLIIMDCNMKENVSLVYLLKTCLKCPYVKKIPYSSKSPAPWCLTTIRMLPVLSFCLHIHSFMLFVSNVAFCFPAVKDPASIRNAISGFRFDLGQVATSLSLPSLQTGVPLRPRAYVRSYRFGRTGVFLPLLHCTSLTHIKQH